MATFDIQQLQTDTTHKNPRIILKKALELFDNIAIAFSGAEKMWH
jgi:phosphoadenosine phosphosulfate reductase